MTSSLEQLKKLTTVVADTGEFSEMKKYTPQDATTNPSLLYSAAQKEAYAGVVDEAVNFAKEKGGDITEQVNNAIDKLYVLFGIKILEIIPGRVSTEVDARLSYDKESTIKKAHTIIELYEKAGIPRDRILIKIASTWEGLMAAKELEAEGIHCNLTLLFNIYQAAVAAENGITLVSPFAGRITDFYKAKEGLSDFPPVEEDPGVISVRNIYNYYKKYNFKTEVMGASFRHPGQVIALAGVDLLTISPKILESLNEDTTEIIAKVDEKTAAESDLERLPVDELSFRWALNEDEMAYIKLGEGIRRFAADTIKLEALIKEKL